MISNRWIYSLPLLCVLLLLGAWILLREPAPGESDPRTPETLTVLCASELRFSAERIAEAFQRRYGIRVALEYGGFSRLIDRIESGDEGDLLLAGGGNETDAMAAGALFAEIRVIEIPVGHQRTASITAALLAGASDPELAQDFLRFLEGPAARDAFERFPVHLVPTNL